MNHLGRIENVASTNVHSIGVIHYQKEYAANRNGGILV